MKITRKQKKKLAKLLFFHGSKFLFENQEELAGQVGETWRNIANILLGYGCVEPP